MRCHRLVFGVYVTYCDDQNIITYFYKETDRSYTMESLQTQTISASETAPFDAILVAAGTGTRFNEQRPKQFTMLAGRILFSWSLRTLLSFESLNALFLVINPDYERDYMRNLPNDKRIQIVHGGDTRSKSVNNALNVMDQNTPELVLIHDAARPFVKAPTIIHALRVTEDKGAATLAVPVTDTLRRGDDHIAADIIDRDDVWAIQTPQIFKKEILLASADSTAHMHLTDETSLVSHAGYDVTLIKGNHENIKVTTQDDMIMAEKIAASQSELLTGHGYDVHAFGDGDHVMLCGVEIDHEKGLEGHSDADVGLHALVDAIFGALGLGDIGDHFPPSDDKWKDADSADFLKQACEKLIETGATLVNIDITLICEAPKIGPHKEDMKARIGGLCNLPEDRVNIKATTTEGLGFTGRKEGIAAMANVTIKKERQ